MDDLSMNDPATEQPDSGLDRRSLLKKAAVGGAVVFAAPMVLSSPAFAITSGVLLSQIVSLNSTKLNGDYLQIIARPQTCSDSSAATILGATYTIVVNPTGNLVWTDLFTPGVLPKPTNLGVGPVAAQPLGSTFGLGIANSTKLAQAFPLPASFVYTTAVVGATVRAKVKYGCPLPEGTVCLQQDITADVVNAPGLPAGNVDISTVNIVPGAVTPVAC